VESSKVGALHRKPGPREIVPHLFPTKHVVALRIGLAASKKFCA
jgi:hypothetical protein